MDYDSVVYAPNRRIQDHRTSNSPARTIRIEIDEVVLEGFNDGQIDNEKLAARIMANLPGLVQNNAQSISDLAFEIRLGRNKTEYKSGFSKGNAFGEGSIYVSTVDTGSFQLGRSEVTNSANIGQNVSASIVHALADLKTDRKR